MDFGGACDRDARFGACVLRETTSHPSIYFEEARDEPVHGTRFSQQVQQRPPPQLACFDLQTDPNREYVGWNRRHDVPPCSFRSLGPGPFDRRLGNDRAGKCIFLTYLHFHSHSLSLSLYLFLSFSFLLSIDVVLFLIRKSKPFLRDALVLTNFECRTLEAASHENVFERFLRKRTQQRSMDSNRERE